VNAGAQKGRLPIWGWVLIAHFLLILFVPPSIMPVYTADGGISIVICTGDGPLEMRIDPATGEPVSGHEDDAGASCHWNALRDVATVPELALAPSASAFFAEQAFIPLAFIPRQPTRFERPPARAPPHLS
jgi:hypothetical protein